MIVPTSHGSIYAMRGFEDGKWFQHAYTHSAPISTTLQPRLSITFRLTSHTGKKIKFVPDTSKPIRVVCEPDFHHVSFQDMYEEVKEFLFPDTTKMFNKTYLNNGRMSGDFLSWADPSSFVYVYGGTPHTGKPMGPLMMQLRDIICGCFRQPLDWGHVTYYPAGTCKLNAHSDDEKVIQYGSDIFALTFMPSRDIREIHIEKKKPKKPKEKTQNKPKEKKKKRTPKQNIAKKLKIK